MAQPSVAREPSMEEILASIRQIIESNEPETVNSELANYTTPFDGDDDLDPVSPVAQDDPDEIHLTIEDELPSFAPEPRRVVPSRPDVNRMAANRMDNMRSAQASEAQEAPAPRFQNPSLSFADPSAQQAPRSIERSEPAVAQMQPQHAPRTEPAVGLPPQVTRREEEPRSMSLADVAARVRAASDRLPNDTLRQQAAEASANVARPVELRQPARPAEPQAGPVEAAPVRPVEPSQAEAPAPAVHAEQASGKDAGRSTETLQAELRQADMRPATPPQPESKKAEAREPEPAVAELRRAEPAMREMPRFEQHEDKNTVQQPEAKVETAEPSNTGVDASLETKALVSPSTGDQVARSFHELADLVNSTAKRSLDEVAEELLRPMLQEWLDDNLPTLVERLVREEIERVARGPRR